MFVGLFVGLLMLVCLSVTVIVCMWLCLNINSFSSSIVDRGVTLLGAQVSHLVDNLWLFGAESRAVSITNG